MKREFINKLLTLYAHSSIFERALCHVAWYQRLVRPITSSAHIVVANQLRQAIEYLCKEKTWSHLTRDVRLHEITLAVLDLRCQNVALASLATTSDMLTHEIWKESLSFDQDISSAISNLSFELELDEVHILDQLWKVDVSHMPEIGRKFYLWSMIELGSLCPCNADVDNIAIFGCRQTFVEVPVDASDALQPVTGNIGNSGGRLALNRLIGEYAARSPTRQEVITRLIK